MATAHVYQAIASVAADMAKQGISKDRKNQQQGYSFRGIDDVYCALAPSLTQHGLVILPRVLSRECVERQTQRGGTLFYVTVDMEFDFVAVADGSKHTVKTMGEAMDSADKATNKAMSAAYKYAAFQAFCIPTEGDNDADAMTHDVAPAKGQPKRQPHAAPTDGGDPACPKCGGPMWDNRDKHAANKKIPAWKCKAGKYDAKTKTASGCDGAIWPSEPEPEPAPVSGEEPSIPDAQGDAELPADQEQIKAMRAELRTLGWTKHEVCAAIAERYPHAPKPSAQWGPDDILAVLNAKDADNFLGHLRDMINAKEA